MTAKDQFGDKLKMTDSKIGSSVECSNYHTWLPRIIRQMKIDYPLVAGELFAEPAAPVGETGAELRARLDLAVVREVMLDELTDELPADAEARVASAQANQRDAVRARELIPVRAHNRMANVAAREANHRKDLGVTADAAKEELKVPQRVAMGADIISAKYVEASLIDSIVNNVAYDRDRDATNSSCSIMNIIQAMCAYRPGKALIVKQEAGDRFYAFRQGRATLDAYNVGFEAVRARAVEQGCIIPEADVICRYLTGLNQKVYEGVIERLDASPAAGGVTLRSHMVYIDTWVKEKMMRSSEFREIVSQSTAHMRGQVTFTVDEGASDEPASVMTVAAMVAPKPKLGGKSKTPWEECPICCCGKRHNPRECFKMLEPAFVAKYVAEATAAKARNTARFSKKSTAGDEGEASNTVLMCTDSYQIEVGETVLAISEKWAEEILILHDDCADASMIKDRELFLTPDKLEPSKGLPYAGLVPGKSVAPEMGVNYASGWATDYTSPKVLPI